MTATPQSNSTLQEIADVLRANQTFALCGHVSPDGDCLGSQLALAHVLRALGKQMELLLVQDAPIDDKLSFLPGSDGFVSSAEIAHRGQSFDVFVALDVPTRERIGEAACAVLDAAADSVTVDHHAVPTVMAKHVHVDPDAASTSMLVWQLARLLMDKPPLDAAVCAYTGLVTDTGCFQYQNTDVRAFNAAADMVAYGVSPSHITREVMQNRSLASVRLESIASSRMELFANGQAALGWVSAADMGACGAKKEDADGIVNMLRSIRGVRVACALREQDGEIRGNLRSKDETDVSVLARELGGGGHAGAAGFTLRCSMEEAVATMSSRLASIFDNQGAVGEGVQA